MRFQGRSTALAPLLPALAVLAACQQLDQVSPLDVAGGAPVSRSIGPEGGLISIPPRLSIEFPAGALPQSVFIPLTPRPATLPFPPDAGRVVPGTAFDVGPAGVLLAAPARVFLWVPQSLLDLDAGEDLRLVIAVERTDGSVSLSAGSYDATNGLLSGLIDEIGPIAAVIATDAIAIELGGPPTLDGGPFSFRPFPAAGPSAVPPAGKVRFSSACSLGERNCFSSGLIRVWVSGELEDRFGSRLALLNADMSAELELTEFHPITEQPTAAVGRFELNGDLRARLRSLIGGSRVEHVKATGVIIDPGETMLSISGNQMEFGETIDDEDKITFGDILEFEVSVIGTSEMLTVRLEDEIVITGSDGSETIGQIIAHVRLRR